MLKGLSSRPTAYSPTLNNLRGILWMMLAVTALSGMFVIIKQMAAELPVFVVAILRTGFALALLTPWMVRVGIGGILTRRIGTHFYRAFFGIASFVCVVYALGHLLMADAMVLAFTTPLWSIIISGVVLHEIAGPRRTIATIIGFSGVLLIVKPQLGLQPAMLVALGSALLTSLAMITMKRLSATEPPTRNVFYFFFFGSLLLVPPAIWTWQTPTWTQLAWLFGAGLLGTVGQDCLARAYDAADVTAVAPFDFARLPLAALFGFLFFHEIPDLWTIAGTLIILAASLYIVRRESALRKAAVATRGKSG